ncbi:hypothetical protein KBB17_03005 [Candidatus Saccharibacteria bacterium]|jgi:hypothetical protein|nr:hypothetical protein [Candidatus Saccharibacteria bacterium]MBP9131910.1 hypothetical protein [Candidatus Saccharibacteria bacterium]
MPRIYNRSRTASNVFNVVCIKHKITACTKQTCRDRFADRIAERARNARKAAHFGSWIISSGGFA